MLDDKDLDIDKVRRIRQRSRCFRTIERRTSRIGKINLMSFKSTYDFLYRLRTLLEVDTYAFIIPIFADDGLSVTGLYPLQSQSVSIMEHKGITYLRYRFANGKTAAIEYDRVGVLTKMNYANEFLAMVMVYCITQ